MPLARVLVAWVLVARVLVAWVLAAWVLVAWVLVARARTVAARAGAAADACFIRFPDICAVDSGSAVDPGDGNAPYPPRSPKQPQ